MTNQTFRSKHVLGEKKHILQNGYYNSHIYPVILCLHIFSFFYKYKIIFSTVQIVLNQSSAYTPLYGSLPF